MSGDAWYPKERRLLKKNMLYHEGKSKVNNFLLGDLIIGNVLSDNGAHSFIKDATKNAPGEMPF